MFVKICVCLVALVSLCYAASGSYVEDKKAEGPATVSPSGEFRGAWMNSRRGRRFEAYRGIRYASPPTGELRFQPPQLIHKYPEPVDASEEGPACPLPAPPGYYVDEDCLRLNVYTPGNMSSSASLPVIFFIHPGGFYSMTGRSDLAGPHYLLDRDLVLVTINYRLGSLGFLSTGDKLAPGNNGFKDQVAALKWVQRNIRSFGGDPNLVTIAGTSAGSISVMLHMISPMSKGLFHRGISMSGAAVTKGPLLRDMKDLAIKQAQLLHCPWNSSEAIITCLKTKSWRELGDSLKGFFEFGYDPIGVWMPIVERDLGQERFLPTQPEEAIREGRMHAVPWIVSQTTLEFYWNAFTILRNETLRKSMNDNWDCQAPISFMLPDPSHTKTRELRRVYLGEKQLADDQESADGLGRLYGDSIIGFPVHRMANLMSRHSTQPVWYYEFAYVGNNSHYEDPVKHKPIGAMHHDDLIYLFTLSYRFPTIPTDSPHSHMVDKMTAIWYNFARYGNPSATSDTPELSAMRWPAMTPRERKYLRVGDSFSVHNKMFEERYKLWEELYPIQY